MPSTLYEMLSEQATAYPDHPAILAPNKAGLSFSDLFERNQLVRQRLNQLGVGRNTRVGVVARTRDAMGAAVLAVGSVGVVAPLNPNSTPDEFEFAVNDFGLVAVIIECGLEDLASRAVALKLNVIEMVASETRAGFFELNGNDAVTAPDLGLPQPEDVLLLLHTSGTVARPKIVPITHGRKVHPLNNDPGDTRLGPGDRVLHTLPLFHSEGLYQLITPLTVGASIVLAPFDPSRFVSLIAEFSPTRFTLVSSMHQMVLNAIKDSESLPLATSLRFVESSSAALPKNLKSRMQAVYGVPIIELYGSSEAGGISDMGFDQVDIPEGSVGKRRHDGIGIMDEDGAVLPPMTQGEICVNSPIVIKGYENNPEANEAAFRNGYYRTGDLGYLDENDYLFIVGRLQETINRGGDKISPAEIDEVLLEHPGIEACAAFRVEHQELGEEIWAAVVPKTGQELKTAEVRAFAARSLSFERVPKKIIFLSELPLSEVGKVMRRTLTERFGVRHG